MSNVDTAIIIKLYAQDLISKRNKLRKPKERQEGTAKQILERKEIGVQEEVQDLEMDLKIQSNQKKAKWPRKAL